MGISAIIAGGLGAIGSIGSSVIGSNAADKASQQQAAAQQQALAVQQQMFQTAQNTLKPFTDAGTSVLPTLQALITPGANQNATLEQTPGFQFQSQYGTKAATNALAARGLGASAGPLATAISNYNQGLAGTTWQSVVNSLQNYANMGASSANSLANAALGSGNSQAASLTGIGNAQASGTLGSANALAGGLTGTTNALSSAALLAGAGGGGLYGNIGKMPATGAGSPSDFQSNLYAISQGINPWG